MARVSIDLYASVRDAAGTSHLEVEADDMRDLLRGLVDMFGDRMRALVGPEGSAGHVVVLLNGMSVDLGSRARPLRDGDEVSVFPPISGG